MPDAADAPRDASAPDVPLPVPAATLPVSPPPPPTPASSPPRRLAPSAGEAGPAYAHAPAPAAHPARAAIPAALGARPLEGALAAVSARTPSLTAPRALDRDLSSAARLANPDRSRPAPERAPEPGGRAPEPPPPQGAGLAPAQPPAAVAAPQVKDTAPAAAPLPPLPPEWTASGAVLSSAAHLRLASGTLGDIALHLRLRDGAAHVRLETDARGALDARALEARAPELSRALAAEGIALARLEVEPRAPAASPPASGAETGAGRSFSDGGQRQQADRDRGEPPAAPTALTPPAVARPRRGRSSAHDVTA